MFGVWYNGDRRNDKEGHVDMIAVIVMCMVVIVGLIGYIVFLRRDEFGHMKSCYGDEQDDTGTAEAELDEEADHWEHFWDWKIYTQQTGSPEWVTWGIVQAQNRGILQMVQLYIGRDPEKNDIVLHDKSVSRSHARLIFDDNHDKWIFENLTKSTQTIYLGEGKENRVMETKERIEMQEKRSYIFLLGETYICFEAVAEENIV